MKIKKFSIIEKEHFQDFEYIYRVIESMKIKVKPAFGIYVKDFEVLITDANCNNMIDNTQTIGLYQTACRIKKNRHKSRKICTTT